VGAAHARGGLEHDLRALLGAGMGQLGRGAEGLQQGQDSRVPQTGSEDAFEGGVDGGEQSAQQVGGAGGVLGKVVVVSQSHGQFGPHALVGVDGMQQVGHGARGIGDDVGIAGVGFARAGVQIGESAHRQAWQVGDFASTSAGDSHRQGAEGGRLVDHDQDLPLARQTGEQLPQLGLTVGQLLIEGRAAIGRQGRAVMLGLADGQGAEDIDRGEVVAGHRVSPPLPAQRVPLR